MGGGVIGESVPSNFIFFWIQLITRQSEILKTKRLLENIQNDFVRPAMFLNLKKGN